MIYYSTRLKNNTWLFKITSSSSSSPGAKMPTKYLYISPAICQTPRCSSKMVTWSDQDLHDLLTIVDVLESLRLMMPFNKSVNKNLRKSWLFQYLPFSISANLDSSSVIIGFFDIWCLCEKPIWRPRSQIIRWWIPALETKHQRDWNDPHLVQTNRTNHRTTAPTVPDLVFRTGFH